MNKKRHRSDEEEPYYRNLIVRNIPGQIPDQDVVECLQTEYRKYGRCKVQMGKEGDVRVGLVDFVHHDDAREAKNAKGHLVMNDKRLKIDIWYGNNQGGKQQRDRSRSPVRGRRSPEYDYDRPSHHGGHGGHHHGGRGGHHRSHGGRDGSPPSFRGGYRGRGGGGRGGYSSRGGHAPRDSGHAPSHRGDGDEYQPRGTKPEFEFPRDEAGRKRTHLQEEKFFPGGRAHRPGDDLPPEDDPGSTRSLFLGNLDRSLTREEIYSEFEEFGDILECDIKQARNANHSNFGFVKYHDLNMAWKAKLAMNGKVLHRNPIRVGWGRPVPSKVLWIGGLGPEVTTNLLQRECNKFGSIYNIKKNDNCDWAEITFGSIDSVTYAISGLRGQRLPGSERRCRVDYAFTQEGAEKIGTFSSLSAYHERRARESGSMRELHSALGDCWEGQFEVKKNPIPARISLISGDQKRLGSCVNDLSKMSIKHRLTFNHKLANSMSEKAKQGKTGAFMLITKGHPENPTDRSIKSLNKYFQLTNSVGMVYINSDERAVMFIYPASSWTEGIISSYAPLLAGRLKGAVYMLAYMGYVPSDEYQKLKKAAQEDKAALLM